MSNPAAFKEIVRRIEERGKIAFEEFMYASLYHPACGYYTSGREKIGRDGDFYTSSNVHMAFGACIMGQVEEMAGILKDSPIHLVEAGAGSGLLCTDILASARERAPELFNKLRYVIVEKSPDFAERQRKLIEEAGLGEKVSWEPSISGALNDDIGIVLSNELIDAFPVHKVKHSNGRWNEIYVAFENGRLIETEDRLSGQRLSDFLTRLEGPFEDGYTTEVNLRAIDWLKEVGSHLKKGFVITIDYGYPREELYSPGRNRGTLMCYHKHQVSENPYINIGEQDITSHVDFTSLGEAGIPMGLEVTGFTSQSYFLMGCGIEEEFQPIYAPTLDKGETWGGDAFKKNITLKKLMMPGGMGSMFKVLIQHKGMERPRLRGFSFRDMAKYL